MLVYVRRLLRRFHPVPATLTDAHDVLHAFLLHGLARGWLDRKDVVHPRRLYRVAIWRWLRNESRGERSRRGRFERGPRERRFAADGAAAPGSLDRLADPEPLRGILPVALQRFRWKHPTYAVLIDLLLERAPGCPSPDDIAAKLGIPRHRVADRLHRARCAFRAVLRATWAEPGRGCADAVLPW